MAKFCAKCGAEVKEKSNFCAKCGVSVNETNEDNVVLKSQIAAGLFGIFLGAVGIHNFYLGYTGKAIAQLLITVLSFGILSFIPAIWGFIEGILILCGNINVDANGNKLGE